MAAAGERAAPRARARAALLVLPPRLVLVRAALLVHQGLRLPRVLRARAAAGVVAVVASPAAAAVVAVR